MSSCSALDVSGVEAGEVGECAGGGTVRSRPNANSLEKGVCVG